MTEIRLENVTKAYGSGAPAVDDISLTIAPGEFFFLLGPSGCGKTTLLRMVAGLLDLSAGRIYFGSKDVTDLPAQRRSAAMVFQNYALWPHMTVRQNVEFGPRMQGKTALQRQELMTANLRRVEMLDYQKRKPAALSGGQQQRIAVARALAAGGDVLLLDEPLSNLDARLRQHMRGELRGLVKSSGMTAIYVTHDQSEALSMADRIAIMDAGKIAQVGTPQELYEQPCSRFVADFLGEINFISGQMISSSAGGPSQIKTAAGAVTSTRPCPALGSSVTCCVRPEHIAIQPLGVTGPAGAVVLPARVISRAYLGGTSQYVCRLADQSDWKISQLGTLAALSENQEVHLVIEPSRINLLTR
jgi:iron(III) transport system ATP-binding protein